jgi:LuxR family maltose regulon positive regulatory protein
MEMHGFLADAIGHALATQDWELSSRLVQQVAGDLLKRGEIATLLSWFERIPAENVRADPGLSYAFAWPLILAGQLDLAETLLSIAEAAAQGDPPFLGAVLTAQSNLARTRDDLPRTIDLSRRALEYVPKTDLVSRSLLALNLGLAYWHSGQNNAAEAALLEAQGTAQACGNAHALLAAIIFLGRVHAVRGELRQAAGIYRTAIQKGGQVPILAIAHLDLGALHYEWNELEACRVELKLALELNRYSGNAEIQAAIYLVQARLECTHRDMPAMEAVFGELHKLEEAGGLPEPARQRILDCQVDLTLRGGDLEAARSLVEQGTPDLDTHPFYRFLGLTAARLALAQGQKGEATRILAQCLERAEQNGWGYGAWRWRFTGVGGGYSGSCPRYPYGRPGTLQPDGFRECTPIAVTASATHPGSCSAGVQPFYVGQILKAIGQQPKGHAGRKRS